MSHISGKNQELNSLGDNEHELLQVSSKCSYVLELLLMMGLFCAVLVGLCVLEPHSTDWVSILCKRQDTCKLLVIWVICQKLHSLQRVIYVRCILAGTNWGVEND